ncbi:hypothetical protein SSS_06211 [Sarcoptes scabiei]|uniref:Uncharacterized protein n=1 Tax=Sarcoptes scabiei TaxID=52283 RepID=A0A834REG2_SARSC|nr:hypothetical protein SSS_06211 [Sarcoptes scabiei]
MSGSTNLHFSKRAVEVTFSSIDDLRLRLIRLRESRSETIQLSSDHMEYMQTIEEDLDDLKTLVNAISSSLWRKILLTRANHGDLEDLTAHYREFRSECHRSHIARLELIRQIEVLRQMETEQIQWFMQIECYLEHLKNFLTFLDSLFRTQFFVVSRLIRLNTRFHRTNLAHHRSRMQIIHLLDEIDPSHTDYISVRAVYLGVEILVNETLQFYRELLPQI